VGNLQGPTAIAPRCSPGKGIEKTLSTITIDEIYCKGCHLCIDQCPKAVLKVSSRRNAKGYLVPQVDRPEDCTACRLCELICPDMAITVEKSDHEK